jgi:hypothetical protein
MASDFVSTTKKKRGHGKMATKKELAKLKNIVLLYKFL